LAFCRLLLASFLLVSCNPVAPVPAADKGQEPDDNPGSVKDLKVKINEVMVRNTKTLADSEGNFPPWIELYNPTDSAVNLAGVPLSDDLGLAEKWVIPAVAKAVIEPRGFLVIFCDGTQGNASAPGSADEIHAGFELKPAALELILNKGADILFFDASRLEADQSGGRFPDGEGNPVALSMPTPGAPDKEPRGIFLRGDANRDNRLSIADMTAILAILFQGRPKPACQDRLDANDDGAVNVSDPLYLGQSLFQHGPPPPPPFPRGGFDPTEDSLPCLPD
jgi:hypothetical protein